MMMQNYADADPKSPMGNISPLRAVQYGAIDKGKSFLDIIMNTTSTQGQARTLALHISSSRWVLFPLIRVDPTSSSVSARSIL